MVRTAEDKLNTVCDQAGVRIATPIHLPTMISAEEALARGVTAKGVGQDELKEAIVAILLAAVSLEAATHWVAEQIDPAFRDSIEGLPLHERWAAVVARRDGQAPPMGSGLGQAVRRLAEVPLMAPPFEQLRTDVEVRRIMVYDALRGPKRAGSLDEFEPTTPGRGTAPDTYKAVALH